MNTSEEKIAEVKEIIEELLLSGNTGCANDEPGQEECYWELRGSDMTRLISLLEINEFALDNN
jgi:hypothetical protein